MARRRRPRMEPNGTFTELSRNQKPNGTPKEKNKFHSNRMELCSLPVPSPKVPHYLPKILAANPKPGLSHAYVFHDDWCAIFKGGTCDCNPDVEVRGEGDAIH